MRSKFLYPFFLWLLLTNCFNPSAIAQSFSIIGNAKRVNIPFKLVRNLVVIQLKDQ